MSKCKICGKWLFTGDTCSSCEEEQKQNRSRIEKEKREAEDNAAYLTRIAKDTMRPIERASKYTEELMQALTIVFRSGRQCMDEVMHVEITKEQKDLFDRTVGFFAFPFQTKRNGINEDTYILDLSDARVIGLLLMNISLIATSMSSNACTNISAAYASKYRQVYGSAPTKEFGVVMAQKAQEISLQLHKQHCSTMIAEYCETTRSHGVDSRTILLFDRIEPIDR
jgi:uncharacterized Zn finger protein (UPF0148 family)